MFKITYDAKHGKTYPDGEIEDAVEYMMSSGSGEITVSNEMFIYGVRARIVKGDLDYKKVVFIFEDYEISPDKAAYLNEWPKGFCNYFDKFLCEILDWREK